MSKLVTLTDIDGDPVAIPVNGIALVAKSQVGPDGLITGAKAIVSTTNGWTLQVRDSVNDIVAAVNETVGSLRH